MTREKKNQLYKKIIAGINAAIEKLYSDARKYGWELVISENGKIKKIKPA